MRAINIGDYKTTKRLIKNGIDINAKNICNRTTLFYAVMKGDIRMVKELINGGADY